MADGKKKKKGTGDNPPSYEDALRQEVEEPDFSHDGCWMRIIKHFVAWSFFRFLMHRLGRIQSGPDINQDIEHHLPFSKSQTRRARIVQTDNTRVRCYRLFIIFMIFSWLGLAFAVPMSMILTGVFQVEQCRFMNHVIVIYLIVSGVFTLLFFLLRLFICSCQACVSCYRDRLPGTALAMTVCLTEAFAFVLMFFVIVWLGVGVYYIFYLPTGTTINKEDPNDPTYCSPSVLTPATVFLVLQFFMIPWSLLACTSICCGAHRCCCISAPDEEYPVGMKALTTEDSGEAATAPTAEDGDGTGSGKMTPVNGTSGL